ncbi:MAG: hypothetical protein EPO13_00610 [Actinomycetota bacterium]|nr:MAG: hypothetical protein EPO13_00610 [Actinomycetota bacterium]
MIVRISGEGQYRLADDVIDQVNQLDAALEGALGGTEQEFRTALSALLSRVRADGQLLDDEELLESDVILPGEDASADDVRGMLTDEGLLPG